MTRWRHLLAVTFLVLVLGLGLSGSAKTTITYMGSWGQTAGETGVSDYELMGRLLNEFMELNPDVEVQWINSNDTNQLTAMIAAGVPPDVLYVYHPWVHSFAAQGAFVDLNPFVARDAAEVEPQDFFSGTFESLSYQGQLYALPIWLASSGLYYNKKIFDERGVAYPDDTWTWNDLVSEGKKLARLDAEGEITQFAFTPDGYSFDWSTGPIIWVWSNGGDLIDETGTEFLLGSRAARQALEFYYDVIFLQNISVAPVHHNRQSFWERFFTGQVAIWDSPSWNNTYLANVEFEWDVAPTLMSPFTGQRGAFVHTRGHAILAGSQHPEIAWKLVKFLSSTDVQSRWAFERGYQPSRASAAPSWLEFRPGQRIINLQPFIDSIMVARYIPSIPDPDKNTAFWGVINSTWNRVMNQELPLGLFIDTVTPLVEAALRGDTVE